MTDEAHTEEEPPETEGDTHTVLDDPGPDNPPEVPVMTYEWVQNQIEVSDDELLAALSIEHPLLVRATALDLQNKKLKTVIVKHLDGKI